MEVTYPDVIYPVKLAYNNELKFSLRSLKNTKHGKVFTVGARPDWLNNPNHIDEEQLHSLSYMDVAAKLKIVLERPDITRQVILMNDDMYIVRPINSIPIMHRGYLEDNIERYKNSRVHPNLIERMEELNNFLIFNGVDRPLDYSLHTPMLVDRVNMHKAITMAEEFLEGFGQKTIYGNLCKIGGRKAIDCKVTLKRRGWRQLSPFLSTDDDSFEILGIRKEMESGVFKNKGPLEK